MRSPVAIATDAKAFTTLQARCCLVGIRLDALESDDGQTIFVVTKWAVTRQCASLEEARDVLQAMGIDA